MHMSRSSHRSGTPALWLVRNPLLALAVLLGLTSSAWADVKTFVPTADARVDERYPSTAFGTSSLRTDGGAGSIDQTLLRFAVSGVTGPVSKAVVRLYATSGTADGPTIQPTTSTWTEAVTWSTRPAATGSATADAGAIATGAWQEWDVTPLVKADGTFSFVLAQTSADGIDFASREATAKPQLVVTYTSASTPLPTPGCSTSADCNDGNACTTDACVSGTCQAQANTLACNADGSACTNDACMAGACVAGPAKACADSDPCTADSCDAATGACKFTAISGCGTTSATSVLVSKGSVWRYKDDGTDLGTAWRARLYADSAWKTGWAELGYGDGDEKTVVSYGTSSTYKYVTTYFRTGFDVADPSKVTGLTLQLKRDDGAIVYLNGTEVFRSNLPTGTVTAATLASSAIDTASYYPAAVSPALLVSGTNVLAVEVHQAGRSSSDISFDLELAATGGTGSGGTTTPPPTSEPIPPPPSSGDPVLVGAGDIGLCGSSKPNAVATLLDGIAGTVFAAGDIAYPNGSATDFKNCYDPNWGRHKARTRPAPGNHEYLTSGASAYYNYFGASAGTPGQGWYSYKLGEWLVVALNSNCSSVGGCGVGSAQEKWLRATLAAHTGKCAIAYWHHPRFSSGDHGSNTAVKPLWQALHDYKVEAVISGHDHDYERWVPQNADGVAAADGPVQFVVGTGGTSLYAFPGSKPANSLVRNDKTHGVVKFTLRPTQADFQFVPLPGQTFTDSGSIVCK